MDSLKSFLMEASKYPLLTAAEERSLAADYHNETLPQHVRKAARDKMVLSNIKLVVYIAKNYKNVHFTLEDLIAEGILGLHKAVEKYNPELGYRFSTCATPWIKQAISKAIVDKGRNIAIPAHIFQLLSKYRGVIAELSAAGKPITDEDIARKLDITVDKVKELRSLKYDTISLETPLDGEGKNTIGDLQADNHVETPIEYTEKQLLKEKIHVLLSKFKPREQEIIRLRYGLDGNEEHTLEEVGEIIGITRERVRQIEKQVKTEMKLMWGRPVK